MILELITVCGFMGPLVATPAAGSAAAAATQPASSMTANDAVQQVQKFYARIDKVKATFRQTVKNATFGTQMDSDGTVWLMKPGKMRWDYLEKKTGGVSVKKSFISNGKTLYIVEQLVRAHDGTIDVQSTAAGGTTFTLCVPRAHAAATAGATVH